MQYGHSFTRDLYIWNSHEAEIVTCRINMVCAMIRDMDRKKLKKLRNLLQIIFIILLAVILIYAIVKFIPDIVGLLEGGNEQEIQEYIEGAGKKGVFVLAALQVLQTITIIFPGIPIYMCAGIVYGKIKGTILCYITYVVSNVAIFIASRRMGEAADELFPNKKQAGVSELMKKTKHPAWLVMALCVVPVIPNGIIPHIAAKSSLKLKKFFLAVAIGCVPGIFLFVFCGELLMNGYFGVIVAMLVLGVVGAVLAFIFKNRILKWMNRLFENRNNS